MSLNLSIIIPVYNEKNTILKILDRIKEVPFGDIAVEVVIVDDGSTDGTRDLLQNVNESNFSIVFHEKNNGKGRAIRTGLEKASGDVFVIQDADLEYDPQDLLRLYNEMKKRNFDVIIYGSRVLGREKGKKYSSFIFHIGGLLVTFWANILFRTKLTDEATCYKMFPKKVLEQINLTCTGFEFCPELTGKVLKRGFSIVEIPISYDPRGLEEGKKIKLRDGAIAFWTLFRVWLFY